MLKIECIGCNHIQDAEFIADSDDGVLLVACMECGTEQEIMKSEFHSMVEFDFDLDEDENETIH